MLPFKNGVKILIQPEDGIKPLLDALNRAKKSIRILIFRFDRTEIEKTLVAAVQRGVSVQALIAYTNRGEEKNLRRLEMRLLAQGITVARTADDLVRYHGKMLIVDSKVVYVLAYNFTHMDIDLSRSFGAAITQPAIVKEAVRLFECDSKRKPYTAGHAGLVVSPVNAREQLFSFIEGSKKSLLMYEMKISDRDFLKLLNRKISEGVDVRILSRASVKSGTLPVRKQAGRLHARAILRDGNTAFLGSQSLRKLELEARREIGVIFRDTKAVKQMIAIFEKDWKESEPVASQDPANCTFEMPAKKVAKVVAKQLDVKPVVERLLDRVMETRENASFEPDELAETVREAFRDEMQHAVMHALREMASGLANDEEEKSTSQPAK